MQRVRDHVEVVGADEAACVAVAKSQVDIQGGRMGCLTRRDLSDYDYMSVGKDGFVLICVKPMTSSTRLMNDVI
jgi:hypothetical protein